jgi:hypothetical protein
MCTSFLSPITKSDFLFTAARYIEFNEEPSDLVVMRNKPAKLQCNITAKNNVTISWTKDGVKLDLTNDTRRIILSHGSLYFKTIVRKKKLSPDSGVYRCSGETIVKGRSFKILSRKARLTVVGKLVGGCFAEQYYRSYFLLGSREEHLCMPKQVPKSAIWL